MRSQLLLTAATYTYLGSRILILYTLHSFSTVVSGSSLVANLTRIPISYFFFILLQIYGAPQMKKRK